MATEANARSIGEQAQSETDSQFFRLRVWLRQKDFFSHLLLAVVTFIVLLPLLWIISTSFKDRLEFSTNSASLIPSSFSLVNYMYMFEAIQQLPIYMRNSFILAAGVTLIQVFCSALAGYAFARMRFWGRDFIFIAIIVSMFVPRAGGLMALYELMTFLKLRNSILGLILLFAAGLPAAIFIMRQAFLAIPQEVEESAFIDGANWWQTFWRIALPLAASAMVIIGTLAFVGVWSDYIITYTMIDRDAQMTISVGIKKVLATSYESALSPRFRNQFAGEAADATMLLFSALPVIVIYALMQKWFMRGLTEGAIKF
ncbi:MAG: carbohydrate ABC transporter permease [Caldilineaceae bacterium SB0670_bin_27]|uniref:Carbohydrate ABC transporter permease n=1 Tax=Caldilineaceae bacterium SB0664_bin_27 TaxID=2605260 RepID=A0A6B0YMZ1_9CHLR|nr:carbohydrate ABC transporter permease [Caldilineaceae bacterium SB0664_bin_27]MYJ79286.1 carbohydrate ABC transporter permease [Caldilineaceae bacterium SB0670_bin_27]